ncbi:MAG TPA: hypothetical protein PK109_03090 [Candidatus Paceibacterota bacterium]|nr:hypothetical protein [Candidatus Paceibacterota bacterium]
MSDFKDLQLKTRDARPGEALEINYVGPHGVRGFTALGDRSDDPEVVCIPQGAQLLLSNIPPYLQQRWGIHDTISAVADLRAPEAAKGFFTDGVRIEGRDDHISLQDLPEHLVATVRALA